MPTPSAKLSELKSILSDIGPCTVAFSGGVDSTFLAKVCSEMFADQANAVTLLTPFFPELEKREAIALAEHIGIRHRFLEVPMPSDILTNPFDRCYNCKKLLFGRLQDYCREEEIGPVVEASNADDALDVRPGMRALKELGVRSPLQEAGLTKAEIRAFSRKLDLKTWDKPAFACLATRFPHGETLDHEKLEMVEKAEEFLRGLGVGQVRVRYLDGAAKIETDPKQIALVARKAAKVAAELEKMGFKQITIDLKGYRSGAMRQVFTRRKD
ncbi:MAG: ATP-dependent sacrificial sulfur transferase LarE [Deltaproteobacteria bacterium]